MFGGPSSNTPFGQSTFGQQQQQQQANTAPFGAPAAPPSTLFGSPASAPFGGGGYNAPSAFGAPAAPFGAPAPSAFGAPAPSAFGAPFGAPAAFGTTAPAPSAFGAPSSAGGGLFGTSRTPAPAPFGGYAAAPAPFGASQQQQQPAPSLFGSPTPAPFGGGGFGAPAPGLFGAPAPSGFAAPAPASFAAPAFGASPTPAPGLFGAPATMGFGAAPSTAFGVPAASTGLFGRSPAAAAPTGFATPGPAPGMFASGGGTGSRIAPYQPTSRQDGTSTINLQSISAMDQYHDKSAEELRFEDYSAGNKGTTTPTTSNIGYGSVAPSPPGGLFGSTPAPSSTGFGGGGFGGFGTSGQPAPAPSSYGTFGGTASPATGGLFGSTAPATGFGAAPGGFGGAPASGFGTAAPAGGALFGNTAPAPSIFGSTPAPAPSVFGSPAPAPTLFGSPAPAPSLFGAAPATTGVFGAPAPTTNLFGGASAFGAQPAPAPLFGSAPTAFGAAPTTLLFGAPAPGGFGAPALGTFQSLIPYGAAPAPSMFGGAPAAAPAQPLFPPNAYITSPATGEMLNMRLNAMENARAALEKQQVWQTGSPAKSPASTPTGNPDASSFSSPSLRFYAPRESSAKIRPRGFSRTEPTKPTSTMQRDNRGLTTPQSFLRSTQMHLVIKPDSLQKPRNLELKLDAPSPPPRLPEEMIQPPPVEEPVTNGDNAVKKRVTFDPPKSPGEAYYQHVIGEPFEESLRYHQSPAATKASVVPKLTKAGYEVTPTIEELSCMSEADLASVSRFSVSRPGLGMVEWEGAVDVRGADLDRIVVIEKLDVSVYSRDEAEGRKPERGSKLNRPANIIFYDVWPKDGGKNATPEAKEAFARMVERKTSKMDADFISYDQDSGVWQIRVHHFSRYGLFDDDDDEDENSKVVERTPHKPSLATRKATPYHRPALDTSPDFSLVSDAEMTDTEELVLRQEAEESAKALRASIQEMAGAMILSPEKKTTVVAFEDFDEDDEVADDSTFLAPTQDMLQQALTRPSVFGSHVRKEAADSGVEMHKRMGPSFRVGWLPDGSFFKLGSGTSLVRARPLLSKEKPHTSLLKVHLSCSSRETIDDDGCPLYSLRYQPTTFPGDSSVLARFASAASGDASLIFTLLSHLLQEDGFTTNKEDCTTIQARRMAAVCQFLKDLSADDVAKATKSRSSKLLAVLDAYSGGNIELACDLAAEAGYTELAVMLASGDDSRKDIVRAMLEVAEAGDLSTNPTAIRILKNLGGDTDFENKVFRDGDQSLDWRRRLVLRILQDPNDCLSRILERYEYDVETGVSTPFPSPRYDPTSKTKCLSYKLLEYCADPSKMNITDAVDPNGRTPFAQDFALSFHLAHAISAASGSTPRDFEYLENGYELQLANAGAWEWAVFVALCDIGNPHRWKIERAKDLVLRHYTGDQSTVRTFLERMLSIPSQWFTEALCYRASSNGDATRCVGYATEYDPDFGLTAVSELILPDAIFSLKHAIIVRKIVSDYDLEDDHIIVTVDNFLDLDDIVVNGNITEMNDNEFAGLMKLYKNVERAMNKLKQSTKLKESSLGNRAFFVPLTKHVPMAIMISEATERLQSIHAQLLAVEKSRQLLIQ